MVISKIFGGLGNQMFQYAASRALAFRLGVELKLDLSWYADMGEDTPRTFMLSAFPGMNLTAAMPEEIEALAYKPHGLLRRFLRHPPAHAASYIAEPGFQYWPGFEKLTPPVLLSGYWQNELYFKGVAEVIRKEFAFPQLPPAGEELACRIRNVPDSISVHIRRGDYVSNPVTNAFHGVCAPEYYSRALSHLMGQCGGSSRLFVFSDEPDWARDHFDTSGLPATVVDFSEHAHAPWHDMHLMTLCRHHIIANSSFSWWGAWLAEQGGVICAPERWFAGWWRGKDDPCPKQWVRLENTGNAKNVIASCAIAFHREGLLAHTTLNSLAIARDYAELRGLSVEFVITLDNRDALTEHLVRNHPAIRKSDIVDTVQYGDLGLVRNHAAKLAHGEYVVMLDGDDYYSANYIYATVLEASQNPDSIVFAEYILHFGSCYAYQRYYPVSKNVREYALFTEHTHTSGVTARRELFLEHPYVACPPGFAFEDWHWNYAMTMYNYEFRIAPAAVRFYRRHNRSIMAGTEGQHVLIPPGDFFGMLPVPEQQEIQKALKTTQISVPAHPVHWKTAVKAIIVTLIRQLPGRCSLAVYNTAISALLAAKAVKHTLSCQAGRRDKSGLPDDLYNVFLHMRNAFYIICGKHSLPDVLYTALLEAAKVDGMLHPDHMPDIPEYIPSFDESPGKAFAAAWHSLPEHKYDIVFTAPRIHTGGADRMTLNYMRAAASAGKRVLCITTTDRENRLPPLPDNINVLELGKSIHHLADEHRQLVITRLLLQLAPAVIHAVNDWWTFLCFEKYGRALSQFSRIVTSIFSDAMDQHGVEYGDGTRFLRSFFCQVQTIITDNNLKAQKWQEKFGLPRDYFQPVYNIAHSVYKQCTNPAVRNKVLWAGRFDAEKRLDIAYCIAEKMPDIQFDFYGCMVLDKGNQWVKHLGNLPNARLLGRYEDFSDIPSERYFAFLYTTQCDGLPNVILEALASGLPVVAPDVGGIREVVNAETGWLLESNTDVDAYMAALREMRCDVAEVEKRWSRARDLLLTRHSEENFNRSLFTAYGWLSNKAQRHAGAMSQ